MTNEEAIKIKVCEAIIAALEKQIPKSVVKPWGVYCCPSCGYGQNGNYTYCHSCGQRLDWRADDGKEVH